MSQRVVGGRVAFQVIPGGGSARLAETATAAAPGGAAAARFDDAAHVARARHGDRDAQEALFRRHLRRTRQRVARLLGPDADVDDVVQEAFLDAFERLHRLQDPAAFGAWVLAIAVHKVNRRLRRRRMLRRLGFTSSEASREGVESVASATVSPAQVAEARAVYLWLDTLPPEARVAYLLRHLEGLTVLELSDQMGLSERTVKRRLALAESRVATIRLEHDLQRDGRPAS